METTEKIIESYVRYVRRWATIPNVRCEGQYEIDLLAIDPITHDKYHIEASVSASKVFSLLTGKPFDPADQKMHPPAARRTLAYFRDKKFAAKGITSRLAEYGFKEGEYKKVIVTWGWTEDAKREADGAGIALRTIGRTLRAQVGTPNPDYARGLSLM